MSRLIVATILTLVLGSSTAHAGRFFFSITPPNGGSTFLVGPYPTYGECADTLGSVIYAHPFACHRHPSVYNCRIIGNGFAYPKDFPYPVPANMQIPGPSPIQEASHDYDLKRGWYFLFYTATGGSVEKCSSLPAFRKLAREVPGDEIPYYRNMRCPGAPCFSVGFDTACN